MYRIERTEHRNGEVLHGADRDADELITAAWEDAQKELGGRQ